jgi:hypothetical protein
LERQTDTAAGKGQGQRLEMRIGHSWDSE